MRGDLGALRPSGFRVFLTQEEGCGGAGLAGYDETGGIEWEWQAIDGVMTKAPLAQIIDERTKAACRREVRGGP